MDIMVLDSTLLAPASGEDALIRVLFALLLLVFGHIGVKLTGIASRRIWVKGRDLTKKEVKERHEALQYLTYLLDGAVVVFALLYLNSGITADLITEFIQFLPELLSVILLGILGIIAINLGVKLSSEILEVLGMKSYLREVGLSGSALGIISGLVQAFLYLLLLQVALEQLGIGGSFIRQLVTASSWAAAFLVAGLFFYGFKDLFRNFAAGIYLKNSRLVRPGEEVKMDEENGEIKNISLFSTTVDTDTGYTLLTPNREIMESEIRFKRTKNDIETLEDMKRYFVAEKESYSGPASMEMALDIYGYRKNQEEIGEKAESMEPEDIIEAVEELTEDEVRGAYIPHEKITDVEDEFKAWFNDGGLIAPHFDREQLFSGSGGDYALAVGYESDEVLIIDSSSKTGGVYYIDRQKLYESMPGKGYIVLAPEGTTAYWRIKNDLIYGDKNYYEELSKTLETRLMKILRQGRILSDVMPGSVRNYMEKWKTEEQVTRLWKPGDRGKDETSEGN